jgi:hypothetical protein
VGDQCGFFHIADEMAIPPLTKSPLRTEINAWKPVGTLGTEPLLEPGFLRSSGNVHIAQERVTLPSEGRGREFESRRVRPANKAEKRGKLWRFAG